MTGKKCETCKVGEIIPMANREICWECAVEKLPAQAMKSIEEGAVKRCKCAKCGFDAPVWVESDYWLCTSCRPETE